MPKERPEPQPGSKSKLKPNSRLAMQQTVHPRVGPRPKRHETFPLGRHLPDDQAIALLRTTPFALRQTPARHFDPAPAHQPANPAKPAHQPAAEEEQES